MDKGNTKIQSLKVYLGKFDDKTLKHGFVIETNVRLESCYEIE